jgi:ABC-type lipoprotein release transport system permease subunit
VALAVLVGVGVGAVLGIASGARRTDSAYERFVAQSSPAALMVASGYVGLGPTMDLGAVAKLPGVRSTSAATFLPAIGRTSSGYRFLPFEAATGAATDGQFGNGVDRWKILSGRRADPLRLDEAVASFEFARRFHVRVGDTVDLRFLPLTTAARLLPAYLARLPDYAAGRATPPGLASVFDGPHVKVRVVGIEAAPYEFPPQGVVLPPLVMTPAFYRKYADSLVREEFLHVRLDPGTDARAFASGMSRQLGAGAFATRTKTTADVQRSIHLEASVLWGLALLVGASALVTIAQALSRQAYTERESYPTMQALGVTRRELVGMGTARAAIIGVGGACLAVVTAILLSPIWPLGHARDAEPHPGFAIDWALLGVGVVVALGFVVVFGMVSTARVTRSLRVPAPAARRVVPASRLIAGSPLPAPATIGVRQVVEPGRGPGAAPVLSAIVASGLAVATVVIATIFVASTDHLLATPRLYGWTSSGDIHTLSLPATPIAAGLAENQQVAAVAAGTTVQLDVSGRTVQGVALNDVHGRVRPDLVNGRSPRTDQEIVLGSRTLDEIGAHIGDKVVVRVGDKADRKRVVGRAIFPEGGDATGHVDEGAQITFDALRALEPDTSPNIVRFRLAHRADTPTVLAEIRDSVAPLQLLPAKAPTTITSFGRTNNLPAIVAAVMAALAAATLAHAMVTSVRRRRREFAILESIGLVRRQRSAIVAASATTFACATAIIGVPIGIVVGRWAWTETAHVLGVPAEPTIDAPMIALVVVGLFAIANFIALLPAAMARRTRAADVLRTE